MVCITEGTKGNTAGSTIDAQSSTQIQPRDHVSKDTLERITSAAIKAQQRFLDNLLEMSRKYGDFRTYSRMTGKIPEEAKVQEEVAISGPILTEGSYTAHIDIPDLSAIREPADRFNAIRDSIEKSAIYAVIEHNHKANDSPLYSTFFKMILNVMPDGEIEEAKELDLSKKDALKQTIDQCVNEIFSGVLARETDVVRGARIAVSYKIDSEGRMKVDSTRRNYFDAHTHRLTVPVPDLFGIEDEGLFYTAFLSAEDSEKVILNESLKAPVESLVAGNLRASKHPECYKFTIQDNNGIVHLNQKGREEFRQLTENMIKALSRDMELFPKIQEGGLVRANCLVEEDGAVKDLKLHYIELDPTYPMAIRERLPDTEDAPDSLRKDFFQADAHTHALNMIRGNMSAADHPRRKRYFGRFDFSPEGIIKLGEIHDDIVDEVTEGMLSLDEHRQLPFFLQVKADEPDKDGQTTSLERAKKVYLNQNLSGRFRIDVKPQPDKVLGEKDMRQAAESAVHAAIMRIIGPHMVSINHPLTDYCFETSGSNGKASRYLNERGAEELEGIITPLAEKLSVSLLAMRARVPEHFSGYRALIEHAFNPDDSFRYLGTAHEYFIPTRESLRFALPDRRKMLASLPEEKRESVLVEKYHAFASDVLTGILSANMQGHPSQQEYFRQGEDKRIELTETGRKVLGRTLDKNIRSFANQMQSYSGDGKGGNFIVDYELSKDRIKYVKLHHVWVG